MTPPRTTLLVTAVLATAVAGCGSDTKTVTTPAQTPATGGTGAATGPSETTHVEIVEPLRTESFAPEAIYARASPGVVTVVSAGLASAGSGRDSGGLGSGFVISGDGEIATNAHVVTSGTGASIRQATRVYVRFPDGNQVSAKVRGYDPYADVALLKVSPAGLNLRPLPLGSTKGLRVGAPVAAIGSPFGEEQSLSVGIVSATDRAIDSLTGFSTSGAIQTDAAINHGNSGGPLLGSDGRVLGINSQIRSDSGDGTGVGFAVPVDVVKQSLAQLRATGKVHYAYLGVSSRALYPQAARHFKLKRTVGVWVQEVSRGGPAAKAGIKGGTRTVRYQEQRWRVGGDIITAVEDTKVSGDSALAEALIPHKPGETVTLRVVSMDGKARNVDVKLDERPLNSPPNG